MSACHIPCHTSRTSKPWQQMKKNIFLSRSQALESLSSGCMICLGNSTLLIWNWAMSRKKSLTSDAISSLSRCTTKSAPYMARRRTTASLPVGNFECSSPKAVTTPSRSEFLISLLDVQGEIKRPYVSSGSSFSMPAKKTEHDMRVNDSNALHGTLLTTEHKSTHWLIETNCKVLVSIGKNQISRLW